MSKEYESKTEHKENLIDIAGLFDDLIKGIIQMKWRFLIILVICGAVFCGYKRLTRREGTTGRPSEEEKRSQADDQADHCENRRRCSRTTRNGGGNSHA